MFETVTHYLLPGLLLLVLIGAAAPLSHRGNLVALALAALAAGLAAFALPEALRDSPVAEVASLALGRAGPALIAGVVTWTAARLVIALAGAVLVRKARVTKLGAAYGPPHGLGGWFSLILIRLALEPVAMILLISIVLTSPWSTVTDALGSVFAPVRVPGETFIWWVIGAPVVMCLLWLPLMRALIRRARSLRALATVYLAAALTLNTITFAFEILALGPSVVLGAASCALFGALIAMDGLLLAYVRRSKRVRATFSADPRTAPRLRTILWGFLTSLVVDLARWPQHAVRIWRGEAPLIAPLLLFFVAIVGYLLAPAGATSLVLSLAITGAFAILASVLGLCAWRAALRIRRTYRFGALALPLAALPIVMSGVLISHAHDLDLFDPGEASVHGRVLRIEGGISSRLLDVVPRLLAENPGIVRVELESPGGSAMVGKALGQIVRERQLATRAVGDCSSACTSVFMAGRERDLARNARLGFHSAGAFGLSVGWDEEELAELRRLGATAGFLRQVTQTSFHSIWFPSLAELIESGIVTQRAAGEPPAQTRATPGEAERGS